VYMPDNLPDCIGRDFEAQTSPNGSPEDNGHREPNSGGENYI